jgi:hypothetical protein
VVLREGEHTVWGRADWWWECGRVRVVACGSGLTLMSVKRALDEREWGSWVLTIMLVLVLVPILLLMLDSGSGRTL